MSSKRVRGTASAAGIAPPALITEVYDCLMQVSRKQLGQLLDVLLKACPAAALHTVRDEAAKTGALVAKGRFQMLS